MSTFIFKPTTQLLERGERVRVIKNTIKTKTKVTRWRSKKKKTSKRFRAEQQRHVRIVRRAGISHTYRNRNDRFQSTASVPSRLVSLRRGDRQTGTKRTDTDDYRRMYVAFSQELAECDLFA